MGKIVVLFFFSLLITEKCFSYDDVITHPKISEIAVQQSSLRTELLNKLGLEFQKGYDSLINGTTVINLIRKGSVDEDKSMCRRGNHMHNPLLIWKDSYDSDTWWSQKGCDSIFRWPTRYSNVTWATGLDSPPPDVITTGFDQVPEEIKNWNIARSHYYKAVTSTTNLKAPYPPGRDRYLADTFLVLGHVLHLLQDMAVPAHTRNDFSSHLINALRQPYETYVKVNNDALMKYAVAEIAADRDRLTNRKYYPHTKAHHTEYWDTNRYNGSNPSTLLDIGLAEFSNANYLSDYTIPSNLPTQEHRFPYPSIAASNVSGPSYQICSHEANPGFVYKYISRSNGAPCPSPTNIAAIDHFLVVALPFETRMPTFNSYMWIDDNVHNTYAKELLPRAIGYSAGLLDYFFRGKIDISLPPRGVFSSTSNSGQGFTRITLIATNLTDNGENMENGEIKLVIRYKEALSDPFLSYPVQKGDFKYTVIPEANNVTGLQNSAGKELLFDLSNSPLPINAVDVSLQVVFKGKLGLEDGAVAVGFKDIREPSPLDIFNNMDKVCLSNDWYGAGSQAALDFVSDNNLTMDVNVHDLGNIFIKFANSRVANSELASPTNYDYMSGPISAGEFWRQVYVLGDSEIYYTFYANISPRTGDNLVHDPQAGYYTGAGVINQDAYYPNMYYFREKAWMWSGLGFIQNNISYPIGSQCDLNLLNP